MNQNEKKTLGKKEFNNKLLKKTFSLFLSAQAHTTKCSRGGEREEESARGKESERERKSFPFSQLQISDNFFHFKFFPSSLLVFSLYFLLPLGLCVSSTRIFIVFDKFSRWNFPIFFEVSVSSSFCLLSFSTVARAKIDILNFIAFPAVEQGRRRRTRTQKSKSNRGEITFRLMNSRDFAALLSGTKGEQRIPPSS
jgi:hypothetical protein